jgi:hypothetical protein
MTSLREINTAELHPADRIPFSRGWINTGRAAVQVLRPAWVPIIGIYFFLLFLVVLINNLSAYVIGTEIPNGIFWTYVGLAVTGAQAVSAVMMLQDLIGERASIKRAMRACLRSGCAVAGAAATGTVSIVIVAQFDPRLFFVLHMLFLVLGPPLLLQTVVLERVSLREALSRVPRRLKGRGSDTWFGGLMIGFLLVLLRVEGYRVVAVLVDVLGGGDSLAGTLVDALLRSAVSGVTLSFVAALWFVAYVNACSLAEGTDTTELGRSWRRLEREWET